MTAVFQKAPLCSATWPPAPPIPNIPELDPSLPFSLHWWSDSGHLPHRDPEAAVSGMPHSSHSWDTYCIISESQGAAVTPLSAFHAEHLLQVL